MKCSALALGVVALGCRQPTEILVDISSSALLCSAPAEIQFASLSVVASQNAENLQTDAPAGVSSSCKARGTGVSLGSVALIPKKDNDHAEVLVTAGVIIQNTDGTTVRGDDQSCLAAYRDFLAHPETHCKDHCDPCVVASRSVGFVSHQELHLPMSLDAVCKGVFCAAGKTCGANGDCVSTKTVCESGNCGLDTGTAGAGGAGGAGGDAETVSTSESASSGGGGDGGAGPIVGFLPVLSAAGAVPQVNRITGIPTSDTVAIASEGGVFSCDKDLCTQAGSLGTQGYKGISTYDGVSFIANSSAGDVRTTLNGVAASWDSYACPAVINDVHRSQDLNFVIGNPGTPYWSDFTGSTFCHGNLTTNAGQNRIWSFAPSAAVTSEDVFIISPVNLFSSRNGTFALSTSNGTGKYRDIWGYEVAGVRAVFVADELFPTVTRDLFDVTNAEAFSYWSIPAGLSGTTAVGGYPQADGSVDLWMAAMPATLVGMKVGAPPAAVTQTTTRDIGQNGNPVLSMFVTTNYLWLGTASGLYVGSRPAL